jgi:hypothetical protein
MSRHLALAASGLLLAACASLVSSAASGLADNLSAAVLNQTDPGVVRDGAPAYLLLLDSFIESDPDDPALLAAAADLYASYGTVFAESPERAARLTDRARQYSRQALCLRFTLSCEWPSMTYEEYAATLPRLQAKHAGVVFTYAVASLAYMRSHSDDWNALAELPHVQALLERYLQISDSNSEAAAYTYLGILATLRPPAMGGEPEKGRGYFEHAITLTGGTDLSAKVEFARSYARLMYDRELHDRLLKEVMAADVEVPGFTLTNVLAQRDAAELLESADEYF